MRGQLPRGLFLPHPKVPLRERLFSPSVGAVEHPALIETRHEMLHGQMVDIQVYEPGRAHLSGACGMPRCPLCRTTRDWDEARKLDETIEKNWPVALAVSGHLPPPDIFDPDLHAKRLLPPIKPTATNPNAVLMRANLIARMRKATEQKARKALILDPKQRAKRKRQLEAGRRYRAKARAAAERANRPCQEGQCVVEEWVKLSRWHFRLLMNRPPNSAESGQVRGCSKCPRIETQLKPDWVLL